MLILPRISTGLIHAGLSQVLSNLDQYGFKGTSIIVKAMGKTDAVFLSVHNEAIPIPHKELESIFEKMTRLVKKGNGQKESAGLGLGRYIAKEIVIAHGGQINVTSSKQEGTTFTEKLRHVGKGL